MFPSIEIFFPLRVKLPSRFVMSAKQRNFFGGVAIFKIISRLGVLINAYLGSAQKLSFTEACFTNLNTARGESLFSRRCQWAGLIDQPIETPNSTSALKDFKTWWPTLLWFPVKLFVLFDIFSGDKTNASRCVKNKTYHSDLVFKTRIKKSDFRIKKLKRLKLSLAAGK